MSAVAATSWSQTPWTAAVAGLPDLDLLWNEPLSRHTTFRVGAPVACLAQPRSIAALQTLIGRLRHEGIPHFLLGAGSNLLASDEPWDGVAIQLGYAVAEFIWNPRDLALIRTYYGWERGRNWPGCCGFRCNEGWVASNRWSASPGPWVGQWS